MASTTWLVIAGGLGTRYGEPKYAAVFEGATFLDRTLALVGSVHGPSDNVFVALRDDQPWTAPEGVDRIHDDPRVSGPVAGLLAGVTAASSDDGVDVLVTLPVDMPYVTPRLLRALHETCALTSSITVARSLGSGDTHWTLAAYPASLFGRVTDSIVAGRRSLHGIAQELGFGVVVVDDDIVRNINHKPS